MKQRLRIVLLLLPLLVIGRVVGQESPQPDQRTIEETMRQLEQDIPGPTMRLAAGRQADGTTDVNAVQRFVESMVGETYQRDGNRTYFRLADSEILVICDPDANRMRVMTPVAEADGLSPNDVVRMLEANFDEALDARYALWSDVVWAIFVHPLAELTQLEFTSAVRQVINLQLNYGSTFSSTDVQFGGETETP
ncbi:MAG: hypothetical protein OEV00_03360 [Acidobacteriota bacterium]|nr:hypothetical protein [Acidobacteriota bacterium]MDH3784348.1 hypothetical protein [Acidobacteriota bacterium]